jgi:hypothetical protein
MKQTAVEWLLQRFEDGDMYNVEDAQFIKHQALAMEKEQREISDEEIEKASLTFAKEESYGEFNADLWKGHLFGAKWYRKQLKRGEK